MKPILIILAIFCSTVVLCQDSLKIVVYGQVIDSVQNIPVANIGLQSEVNGINVNKTFSDSVGNYKMVLWLNKKYNYITVYSSRGNFICGTSFEIIANKDSVIQKNIVGVPLKICWDSFLPSPLYFPKNQIQCHPDTLFQAQEQLKHFKSDEYTYFLERRKLEISVYISYDENLITLLKRTKMMRNLALSSGFKKEDFTIKKVGKKPMFICQFCDGCHYEFLKGKGITLSKESYKEEMEQKQREKHLGLRRSVMFNWIKK